MMPAPVALGLFLCRDVQFVGPTLHVNIVEQFSILELPIVPAAAPSFCAYSVLKGSFGQGTVRVRMYRLDHQHLVSVAERPILFPDRLQTVHARIRIDDWVFPVFGDYEFALMVDQDIVAQTTLQVIQGDPT
jgi:hypothetical protein